LFGDPAILASAVGAIAYECGQIAIHAASLAAALGTNLEELTGLRLQDGQ
jgi:hypothetical protein